MIFAQVNHWAGDEREKYFEGSSIPAAVSGDQILLLHRDLLYYEYAGVTSVQDVHCTYTAIG